ncbi:MAG: hypothetical protein AAFY59_06050, partial [Pseudomonadota bacterium]
MTLSRTREEVRRHIENHNESATSYGQSVLRRVIEPLTEAIEEFRKEGEKRRAGRHHHAFTYLSSVPADVIACLTARSIIDRISTPPSLTDVSSRVSLHLRTEILYRDFQEKAPGLWAKIERDMRGDTDRRKRTVFVRAYARYVDGTPEWPAQARIGVGMKMVEMFAKATGFVTIKDRRKGPKTVKEVHPTEEFLQWLDRNRFATGILRPISFPMVVHPQPWSAAYGGGYLSPAMSEVERSFVRTRNRSYLKKLDRMNDRLALVYEAVNRVQNVAWQVNTEVLKVIEETWDRGLDIAKLPRREPIEILPSPIKGSDDRDNLTPAQKAEFKARKREASAIHQQNAKAMSKRLHLSRSLAVARQFSEYPAIYHPHSVDFRGRLYPLASFLQPQGDDISRGLLRFAEGKPIGDGTGPGWLAVHGA